MLTGHNIHERKYVLRAAKKVECTPQLGLLRRPRTPPLQCLRKEGSSTSMATNGMAFIGR